MTKKYHKYTIYVYIKYIFLIYTICIHTYIYIDIHPWTYIKTGHLYAKHIYKVFTHMYVFTYIHIHKCIHTYKDKETNTKNNFQISFYNFAALLLWHDVHESWTWKSQDILSRPHVSQTKWMIKHPNAPSFILWRGN